MAFGRLALAEYYPELSARERDEREAFAVEACHLMRDRFLGEEVWANMGLNVEACARHVRDSALMREYLGLLFSRIVPTIKAVGLWGDRIRNAFAEMNVLHHAEVDLEEQSRADEDIAGEFDRLRAAI